MRRAYTVLMAVAALCCTGFARDRAQGWCEVGGQVVTVLSYQSSAATPVQRSYPSCTVTVYVAGTGTPATIYSDNLGTARSNPFTATSLGAWFFYGDNGRYDVQVSGAGIPSGAFTYGDVNLYDPATLPPAAGASQTVQYNCAGLLCGSANLSWNNSTQLLSVYGIPGTAAIATGSGWIQSAGGFLSDASNGAAFSSATDGAILRGYVTEPNVSNTAGGYFDFAPLMPYSGSSSCTDQWGNVITEPLPLYPETSFGTHHALLWVTTSSVMPSTPTPNCPSPQTALPVDEDYGLTTASYFYANGGFGTDNGSYNSIQSLLGGGYFMTGVTTFGLVQMAENANPGTEIACTNPFSSSPSPCPYNTDGSFKSTPFGGLAYKSGNVYWYKNGDTGTWGTFDFSGGGGGSTTPGGSNGNLQFNGSGSFAGSAYLTWNNVGQQLSIIGLGSGSPAISVTSGYVYASGFNAGTCSAVNCIQAPYGGIQGNQFGLWETGVPSVSLSGQALIYADNTSHLLYYSQNGGTWAPFGSGSGANTTLSNLGTTSVNSSFLFQAGRDIGSATHPVQNLYLVGSGSYSSTSFELTGTPTGTRQLTLPDRTTSVAGYINSPWVSGHCVSIGSTGDLVDAGGACTTGGGGGTVSSGTAGQLAYYSETGTTVSGASLAGTANEIAVNLGSSTFTLSTPQDIATTSNVTFGTVTSTGVVQSSATGSNVAFQTSGGTAFQVFGNGAITTRQGLYLANSAGTFSAGLIPPASISANVTWSLPSSDASGCLQSNGSGVLSISGCTGVSSLNSLTGAISLAGSTNITVTPTTGTVTIGMPSNVSFGTVSTSGAIQSSATGSSVAFQTSGGTAFQVYGNGAITTRQGLYLSNSGGTAYSALTPSASLTTNVSWSLPTADAAGCWLSNGSGTLSVGSCTATGSSLTMQIASPTLLTSYQNDSFQSGSYTYKQGNYLYATWDTGGFGIFDVSNPNVAPILKGSLSCPSTGSSGCNGISLYYAEGLYVVGRYAYVAQMGSFVPGQGSFVVIDVSNPSAPSNITNLTHATALNQPENLTVSGNVAFVTGYNSDSGSSMLTSIDISNPLNPTILGTVANNGTYGCLLSTYVAIQGNTAFVTCRQNTSHTAGSVVSVDISNPASMTALGQITQSATSGLDYPTGIEVRGPHAFVAGTANSYLVVLDVHNPAGMTLETAVQDTTNWPGISNVHLAGNTLYTTSYGSCGPGGHSQISAVNVTYPASPSVLGSLASPVAHGGYACFDHLDISGRTGYAIDDYLGSGGGGIYPVDLGGITTNAINAGRLLTDDADVMKDVRIGGDLFVARGVSVGTGVGVTKTCSTSITAVTVTGGIITSITCP